MQQEPWSANPTAGRTAGIVRKLLSSVETPPQITRIETHLVTLLAGQRSGVHFHPGGVVGVVTDGTIVFETGGEVRHLCAGDTFVEPAGQIVERFDNASSDKPASFVANYMLRDGLPLFVPFNDRDAERAVQGAPEWFSGTVRLRDISPHFEGSRLHVYAVDFEPCARTAWHEHPLGQLLYGTYGRGLVQIEEQPPVFLQPGHWAAAPPNTRHWHGAEPGHAFGHVAMQEAAADGTTVRWHEHVDDTEYLATASRVRLRELQP
jgi:quercetin dioxygenase-like cupin family protein